MLVDVRLLIHHEETIGILLQLCQSFQDCALHPGGDLTVIEIVVAADNGSLLLQKFLRCLDIGGICPVIRMGGESGGGGTGGYLGGHHCGGHAPFDCQLGQTFHRLVADVLPYIGIDGLVAGSQCGAAGGTVGDTGQGIGAGKTVMGE